MEGGEGGGVGVEVCGVVVVGGFGGDGGEGRGREEVGQGGGVW